MLLAYYIASLNIEHEYHGRMREYEPFEGICFADTLELAEGKEVCMFGEKKTESVECEKAAQIMVIIGNPPYNGWQKSENDNNRNRRYPIIDERIHETYAKDSNASYKNALSDSYIKFFRWATDRLGDHDGIICFVSNNGFLKGIAFDGFRKRLAKDFTHVYHLDLGGNARKGGGGNVFGIMVGVGITILVRRRTGIQVEDQPARIFYYKVYEDQSGVEKLAFLARKFSSAKIEWQELQPDEKYTWLTDGLHLEFTTFLPIGTKEAKATSNIATETIFRMYGGGVKTNRDTWTYDLDRIVLVTKVKRFLETYNNEVDRWRRRGSSNVTIDDFVTYDDSKIKWSSSLKLDVQRGHYGDFTETKVRQALYRPFCKQWLFFDRTLVERVYQQLQS